jgi:predicted oxidoreductase (fatty acid repression mutant protein)
MSFSTFVEQRRTIYHLGSSIPISEKSIEQLVEHAVKHSPSAFNSQSARVIVLFGDAHNILWSLTKENLRAIVSPDKFGATEDKIASFGAGAGTVLFFEDQSVVDDLMKKFALYAPNFPIWSQQSSGMLQYVVWTGLANINLGASLQHYNEVIESDVAEAFDVPSTWKLIAQMPFGSIETPASDKTFNPIKDRFRVLR